MSVQADEIWAILKEVAYEQKETERKFQETDRKLEKLAISVVIKVMLPKNFSLTVWLMMHI